MFVCVVVSLVVYISYFSWCEYQSCIIYIVSKLNIYYFLLSLRVLSIKDFVPVYKNEWQSFTFLFFHFNFTRIVFVAALAASQQARLHWLAHCLHAGTGQCRHCRASRVHAGTTSHLIQQIAATTRYVRREKSLPSCAGPVIACSCSCTYLFGQFIPKQLSCRLVRFLYMNYLQFTISSVRLFSPHYRNAFVTYL